MGRERDVGNSERKKQQPLTHYCISFNKIISNQKNSTFITQFIGSFHVKIFTNKTKFLFLFGVLLLHTLGFSQNKPIEFSKEKDTISLYKNSEIAYTNLEKLTPTRLEKLNFKNFDGDFQKKFPIADTLEYAVIQFSVHNPQSEDIKIYLTAKDDVAIMNAYRFQNTDYQLISGTGYANRVSDFPLVKNEHQLILEIEKNKTARFLLQFQKYKYTLVIPELELQSENHYLKSLENKKNSEFDLYNLFTNFIAGFQFALLLFGLFKIYFHGFKKIYIFFTLLCLLFLLFYLNEIHVIVFESRFFPDITNKMFYEALGDVFIIVFNFLIISFFDLDKKSFLYRFLAGITAFWILLFFVEAIPFINNSAAILFSRFILNTAAIVDFITLFLIFLFAIKHRNGYRKYLFIGILIMLISSFEVALPRFLNLVHLNPNWIKISDSSYLLLQICDNLNFCFFFIAFIMREKELALEKDSLEITHNQTVEELRKLRTLVEKENIILKDKTKINLDQLVYIKADDHYLSVHTIDGKNHFVRGKLTAIILELPDNFVKCHRSYIVNTNYIKQRQSKFLLMSDHSEIPISRSFKF